MEEHGGVGSFSSPSLSSICPALSREALELPLSLDFTASLTLLSLLQESLLEVDLYYLHQKAQKYIQNQLLLFRLGC